MSDLEDLRNSINTADVAQQLGVSEDVAAQAIDQAVPTLLHGLQGQDSNELADNAQHADGHQLVSSLFGDKTEAVATAAASQGGGSVTDGLVQKLLPILAPIVISYVLNRMGQHTTPVPPTQPQSDQPPQPAPGGDLGSILGGILGGGGAGGGLGSILGGILGGKK